MGRTAQTPRTAVASTVPGATRAPTHPITTTAAAVVNTPKDDDTKSVSGMSDSSIESGFTMVTHDRVPARTSKPNERPEERIKKLLDWLQPTDYLSPGGEYQKHLRAHVPGTGEWVEGTSKFRKWMGMEEKREEGEEVAGREEEDSDVEIVDVEPRKAEEERERTEGGSCLHVHGVAGSGKSVFSAWTIKQLQESPPSTSSAVAAPSGERIVLFFFFRQIVDHNHTSRYLVRDFAAQLLPHSPSLLSALEKLSAEHAVRGNELSLIWPAIVEALERDAQPLRGRVFCVADALDEMDDGDLEDMVAKLVALGTPKNGKPALARVLMTSRPLTRIENSVRQNRGVARMRLDPARLSSDVGHYVDIRMAELLKDGLLGDDANEKCELIRQTICGRANGLFLHARLAIDNLAEGLREGRIDPVELPQRLDELLPSTLRGVYEGMLREHARRTDLTAEQQAQMLACVTRASRPLRLIELGSLVARLMCRGDLRRGKDLVRAGCGKFLELLEDETVSVIHHSFTEFLNDEDRRGDTSAGAFPVLEDDEAHATLVVLLLEYLNGCPHFDTTVDDQPKPQFTPAEYREREQWRNNILLARSQAMSDTKLAHPLVTYATSELVFHLGKIPSGTPQADRVLAALDRYFIPGKPAVETWMLMNWYGPMSASCSVLHLLAGYHWEVPAYVMEHLINRDPALVDTPDTSSHTPLAYAADRGHAKLVELFLARGADPTSGKGSDDGFTPLHRAVQYDRVAVVRLLLAAGVDPLLKTWPVVAATSDEWGRSEKELEEEAEQRRETVLERAFRFDNSEMTQLFLPFIPPEEVNKCFHAARNIEAVRAILETGKADVDSVCNGMTKLFCAARSHDPKLVRLLLEHGANPMKRCEENPSCLEWRERGITTEVPYPHCAWGPTPLHGFVGVKSFCWYGDSDRTKEALAECLHLLVDGGADINACMDKDSYNNERGVTPLHCAVRAKSSLDPVSELWDEPYDPSKDKSAETFVELLLSAGAKVNARTTNGNTPLHFAKPEKPGVAKLLLEYGAWVNARNIEGNTPLHLAEFHNLDAVELLTAHGADVNARNAEGRTPLVEMIHRGRLTWRDRIRKQKRDPSVFLRLLELGNDANQVDNEGNTVLRYLLQSLRGLDGLNLPPFVQELLRAGADPNLKNHKGQPLIWGYGVSYGSDVDPQDEDMLRLLIAGGMDLNARDGVGQTVLFDIVRNENLAKLDLLLRLGADPTVRDSHGRTLLHAAAEHGGMAVPALLAAGVPADAVDDDGNTVIHALLAGSRRYRYNGCGPLQEPLEALLKAGAQPLARNAKGQSVLHLVSCLDFLDFVMDSPHFEGLDVNELDVKGHTPLHQAATLGQLAVWKLICAGADIDAVTVTGLSPLHVAARQGDGNAVCLLLERYRERGTLPAHVNRLGDGRAPLHYACQSGIPAAISALLRHGADAGIADETGLTPLHALAEFTRNAHVVDWSQAGVIVRMLQRAGADVNAEAVVPMADGTGTRRVTPLDLAVEGGCWEMVRRLVAHGAEPRDPHRQSEAFLLATDKKRAAKKARELQAALLPRTPNQDTTTWRGRWAVCDASESPEEAFGLASHGRYLSLVADGQVLLDAVAEECGYAWNSVLHEVLKDGDYDSIKEYAELGGAVLDQNDSCNQTFLHHLVEKGHPDLLEYFSDKVGELEAQEVVRPSRERGGTLLGTACESVSPSLDMVQLLVDKLGADVNAVHDPKNYHRPGPVLHLLAKGENFWQLEAIEYLLSKGADIEARNEDGMTPLLVAASTNPREGPWCEEVVRVLLKHGADVNAVVVEEDGTRGATPLQLSTRSGVTKLLLEHGARAQPGLLSRAVESCTDLGLVRLLLDVGADPNELSSSSGEKAETEGRYMLHEAARPKQNDDPKRRQDAVVELLLSRGADAYAPYPDGRFVLQAIVEDRGIAQTALAHLSRPDHDRKGRGGRTLLASACMPLVPALPRHWQLSATVMVNIVRALIDAGADALITDDEGRAPLHWFCTYHGDMSEQHRDAFRALVRHGPAAVHTADAQGRKPLHLALAAYASRSQTSAFMVQHLLSVGADPAEADPETGDTALHCIAPRLVGEAMAAAEATALFREVATRVDINVGNKAGETPAFSFAAAGFKCTPDRACMVSATDYSLEHDMMHATALDVLINLGADLTAVDARGRTLLHVTAGRDHRDLEEDVVRTFKKLMELGLDPRAEDNELRTPIDLAVARNWRGIVQLFSEEGDGWKGVK
ncbi:hypothetical protein VTJ49DRAFT_3525 [Mycothermus thermophilus]|uniref:Nephrocystin 3-like N-terminal domain-containing protein n=1 Tax=Humicola insolens TaxID=85995 RepID=A0ABR3V7A9_HUMIN